MDDVLQNSAEQYEPRGRLDPAGFARHVTFQTYPPPADLAPFVEHGWSIRWQDAATAYHSDEVMHRPYVDLFMSIEQSGIQGTFRGKRTYTAAAGSGRIIGVRFRPGAFHLLWPGDLADVRDRVLDLQLLFPQVDAPFIERTLAANDEEVIATLFALILDRAPAPDANLDLIDAIIAAIETDESLQTVGTVAAAFGKSERSLQQLFRDYLGVGLKWLLQRRRLLGAARQIRETDQPNWAALAYEFGYSSQQHFITAFTDLLGKTPVQYKRDTMPLP